VGAHPGPRQRRDGLWRGASPNQVQRRLDGDSSTARFDRLRGIGYDGSLLPIADSDNFVFRGATIGGNVTTIAGQATVASTRAVGTYLNAGFDKPMHVYYEPSTGDLFITENSVVRRMICP
jgi:hypothetical protein